jgi:hypothetical protein
LEITPRIGDEQVSIVNPTYPPSWAGDDGKGLPPTPGSFNYAAGNFGDDDPITQADKAARHGVRKLGEHLAEVDSHAEHYSRDGRSAAIHGYADTDAGRDPHAKLEAADAWRAEAHAEVARIRDAMQTPLTPEAQTKAQRDWQRNQTTLEAAQNAGQQIATARQLFAAARTPAEVATLAEEIGPWMAARGLPTDWVDAELAHAAPEYGAAKREAAERDRRFMKARHNVRLEREAVENGRLPDPRLFVDPT